MFAMVSNKLTYLTCFRLELIRAFSPDCGNIQATMPEYGPGLWEYTSTYPEYGNVYLTPCN